MSSPNSEAEDSSGQNNPAALRLLPEIVKKICDHVPNGTIKNLRLTCRFYSAMAALRLDRVFVSANPRNVEVFTAIATDALFSAEITEIIWDDALLYAGPPIPRGEIEAYYASDDDYGDEVNEDAVPDEDGIDWRGDVPGWFRRACRENIFDLKSLKGDDVDSLSHVARAQQVAEHMPMEEAWAYYQELLEQQREVLDSEAHVRALEEHIGSFPALRIITITPATHGRLFNPLYETPMIRAFPRGFNYRVPRGWPVTNLSEPECDDGSDWQGFRVVTRLLAEDKDSGRVTDLRIDVNALETGLNARVFERENRTLTNFETVLARPDFKHLHLDLMVDPFSRQADVFRSGLLKRAIGGAAGGQGLEYLSLRTNVELHGGFRRNEWYVPLSTIFPSTSFSRLRHFGLSRFYVKQDDLLALLASLPQTLRTVELSLLEFMDGEGSYQTLLWRIRDTLGWKDRNPRPTLSVSVDIHYYQPGRAIWVEDELSGFLYQGGSNPFGDDPPSRNHIREGFGQEKDAFEPEHERPHMDLWTLADMGYIKKDNMGSRPVPRP